ncbi:MAG TPA: two-component sensor histidine kinase [Paracoccus solventivorans]|uniref:histidine kinase n=1 Tax=Paracoccus solventivorans TaxID=53463 RepID=A0A832PLR3_9RHOB|nr:ATP-binding protein [Paracoccus solventivorans]HHW33953.1 two-component sensor histidine kinase [Paracoccus solventivorans]
MRAPASLQGRLALWLTLGAVVLWGLALVAAGQQLRREMGQVFDSALEETGQRLLPLAVVEIIGRDEDDDGEPDEDEWEPGDDADDPGDARAQSVATLRAHDEYFTYLVRDAAGRVLIRSHQADLAVFPPYAGMGFAETATHRVYSDAALQGTITISVAEPLAHRRQTERELLLRLALPLLLIVPFSLIGVWLAVRTAMAPVQRFRAGIEARSGTDLSPISDAGLPSEFRPNARAVNRLLARLRNALEAERSFTANSAHELRTPVAAALAQVQRLVIEAPDEPTRARARQVEAALQRLARLSEKLMQLARAEGGRLQAEAPADLVPVLRLLATEMGRDPAHPVALTLPDTPVMAPIDPDAFAILVRNLIENAQRHGQGTGTDGPPEPVQVALSPAGVLRVSNAGPAVPPEQLSRLLRPFERGTTSANGSGLGLAIAQAIASGSGGTLELRSPASGRTDGFEAVFTTTLARPAPAPGA